MNVLSLQQVEKSYGTRTLFQDVTMTITDRQRLGLIGVNGTGKSTFLRLLAGQLEADKGIVERNGKASIYYLPQAPCFTEGASLLENMFLAEHPLLALVREYETAAQGRVDRSEAPAEAELASAEGKRSDAEEERFLRLLSRMDEEGGWQVEQQARIILAKLGFDDIHVPVSRLSGGQRRRLALGQALLYPCDLLLLDEPTNHLDEDSIEWLEKYLTARKGGLLISTHDRYFLDAVCDGILELSDKRFYQYEGSYEAFLTLKTERENMQAATEEKRRQFLKRELAWVRRGAQARSTKQKARLERYEALKAMEKTSRADTVDPISLKSRLGKTIFDIEHLSFAWPDRKIIEDFTYHVVKHDRIGIVGPNGIGKSTFMRILAGELLPDSGTAGQGETVRIGYFKQELPPFDDTMRVLDYIREDHRYIVLGDGSTLSAGQVLERFLFTPDMHGTLIGRLSGGEKRRLYLLKLLMSAPNVLLLDEPTNDLDIPTLEVLEDFLDSFPGVVVTVCHDRYFLDRVVDKLLVFTGNGQVKLVHGSYSDYREDAAANDQTAEPSAAAGERQRNKGSQAVKVSGAEAGAQSGNELEKTVSQEAKGLTLAEQLEYDKILTELPDLERLVKGLDQLLANSGSDYENMKDILADREEAGHRIDSLTERWLELEEKM